MSRRYRARKDRREAWYNLTANLWAHVYYMANHFNAVPPRPTEDEYSDLPVLDIRKFYRFKEDEWYAQQAET